MNLRSLFVISGLALAAGLYPTVAAAWCVAGVARGDTLSMRSGPGILYPTVATIAPTACGIKVVGGCIAGWCPVSFRGRSGWSNVSYMISQSGPAGSRGRVGGAGRRQFAHEPRTLAAMHPGRRHGAPPDAGDGGTREIEPPRPAPASLPASRAAQPEREVLPPEARMPSQRQVCVTGVNKGDTLKVRADAGGNSELRYGFLPDTCGINITGDCKEGWCPIEYRGYRGWAEERFLQ